MKYCSYLLLIIYLISVNSSKNCGCAINSIRDKSQNIFHTNSQTNSKFDLKGMVRIIGSKVKIGSDDPIYKEEKFSRYEMVEDFLMDETEVTNKQFGDFIEATKYKTEAEFYEWSFVLDFFNASFFFE